MIRAPWKRVLWTIALLAVAVGTGSLLVGPSGSADKNPLSPEVAYADEPAPRADAAPPVSENGKAAKPAGQLQAAPKTTDSAKDNATPSSDSVARHAEERRQLLETLGALSTAHFYQTYLNIGLLADAKAKGLYSPKDAFKVLDSVLALHKSVDRKLAALDKIDLDREDRASLEQMSRLSALLRKQAKNLQIFWDTDKDEDAALYESVRKETWASLSKLMGIGP
ncbi:MAG: hypothetical protein ACJ8FY_17730 [Gemmataceae bacterium]